MKRRFLEGEAASPGQEGPALLKGGRGLPRLPGPRMGGVAHRKAPGATIGEKKTPFPPSGVLADFGLARPGLARYASPRLQPGRLGRGGGAPDRNSPPPHAPFLPVRPAGKRVPGGPGRAARHAGYPPPPPPPPRRRRFPGSPHKTAAAAAATRTLTTEASAAPPPRPRDARRGRGRTREVGRQVAAARPLRPRASSSAPAWRGREGEEKKTRRRVTPSLPPSVCFPRLSPRPRARDSVWIPLSLFFFLHPPISRLVPRNLTNLSPFPAWGWRKRKISAAYFRFLCDRPPTQAKHRQTGKVSTDALRGVYLLVRFCPANFRSWAVEKEFFYRSGGLPRMFH
ncbi:collagen alpha-1(I) chain-like [Crotalus tigris]|uniref:collagen alpha-1(I) chain-like n=1 Tax=Crotalus tigris TaxID=88082 RepID=UPI00192F8165|nr:collagen alpha-1(I) chain-like [Crotalus tigris]